MSLNYLTFTNNGYQYQLYKTYQAEDESYTTGVTVKDAKGKEQILTGYTSQ
jgi:hypothetical protein